MLILLSHGDVDMACKLDTLLVNNWFISLVHALFSSCFSVHYRVMEHAGSLESTKEAPELPEAIL